MNECRTNQTSTHVTEKNSYNDSSNSSVTYEDFQVIQSDYYVSHEYTRPQLYNTSAHPASVSPSKNIIVDWETASASAPQMIVNQKLSYLGVHIADPKEYERRYANELVDTHDIPFDTDDLNFNLPHGEKLASEVSTHAEFQLVGDVDALKLIDRNKVNLKEYYLNNF